MAKTKSKKSFLIVVAAIIAIAVIAFLVLSNSSSKDETSANSSGSKSSSELPKYTPSEVIKDYSKYVGKTFILVGTLNQIGDTGVYIVGDGISGGAVKVDFGKSDIDQSQYVNVADTSPQGSTGKVTPKGQVSVTGELTQSKTETKTPYVFVVKSVSK